MSPPPPYRRPDLAAVRPFLTIVLAAILKREIRATGAIVVGYWPYEGSARLGLFGCLCECGLWGPRPDGHGSFVHLRESGFWGQIAGESEADAAGREA